MSEVTSAAKDETTRQVIILGFSIVGLVITAGVLKMVDDIDNWRTLKMRTALGVRRVCQHEADRWQKWADDAGSSYNREKA